MIKKTVSIAALVTIIGVSLAFRLTADTEKAPTTAHARPVTATSIKMQDGYDVWRSFTGRATADRVAALAFEQPGLIVSVFVRLGDQVKKGDTIAVLDTARLKAQRGQLTAEKGDIEANLNLANRTLARLEKTHKAGHTSNQRLDEATANAISLRSKLVQIKAALHLNAVDIAKSSVRAPFDGVIAAQMIDEGTVIGAGQPIATIVETGKIEAHIGLQPSMALSLRNGGSYRLLDINRRDIEGSFRSVLPVIEGQTRTMMASFDLKADQVADGDLITLLIRDHKKQTGAWVPLRALSADVRGLWRLYTIDKDNRVRFENVQILYSEGNRVFVTGTIANGDKIIAAGISRVTAGDLVQIVPPSSQTQVGN